MFNVNDLYFINLMFIILILFINTILTVYILNRLRKLETEVKIDDLLLDAICTKVNLSLEDFIDDEYENAEDEDEDYVNGEIKEYDDIN